MEKHTLFTLVALFAFIIAPAMNPFLFGTPPPVPTNLQASDSTFTDRIHLEWTGSTGVTYYEVYRATSSTGSRTHLGHASSASYDDSAATAGKQYWYWVNACDADNVCSKVSSSDTGMRALALRPVVPTSLAASDGTFVDRVTLIWAAVEGTDYYEVYRATSPTGSRTHLGHAYSPTWDDKACTAGKTYTYWVNACTSADLCSARSAPDAGYRAIVAEPKPTAPASLVASDGEFLDHVHLGWNAVSGIAYYEVYRAESASGSRTHLAHATDAFFDDLAAAPEKTYTYWVNACTASNLCSEVSSPDTGFVATCAKVSGVPQLLTPENGAQAWGDLEDDQLAFNWSAVPGTNRYELVITEAATNTVVKDLLEQGTSDTLWGLGPDEYTWHVRALHPIEGCDAPGDWSETWRVTMNYYPPPGPVSNVQASDATYLDFVHISWSASTEGAKVENYQIFRADSPTGTPKRIDSVAKWDTYYDDYGVTVGQLYYYWVAACAYTTGCSDLVGGIQGSASSTGIVRPSIPTGVSATDGALADRVTITWPAVDLAAYYNVYATIWALGPPDRYLGQSTTPSYDDLAAAQDTQYFYWVAACDVNDVCSDYSTPEPGFRALVDPNAFPPPPANFQATDGTYNDYIVITWDPSPTAVHYQLFAADTADGPRSLLASQPGPNFRYPPPLADVT
jgi:fibronectin type 3 domain-containing protein